MQPRISNDTSKYPSPVFAQCFNQRQPWDAALSSRNDSVNCGFFWPRFSLTIDYESLFLLNAPGQLDG